MRRAEHVTHIGAKRNTYRVLVEKLQRNDSLEDLGVGRRIIWKWTFKKKHGRERTGFMRLRTGTCCELLWTRYWTLMSH